MRSTPGTAGCLRGSNCTITQQGSISVGKEAGDKVGPAREDLYPLADLLGPDLRWRSDGLDSSGRLLGRQARARLMRWRFFSTDLGSTVKCTCPSSSMATT